MNSTGKTNAGSIIDLGCGPDKVEGAYGVDRHLYPGVDQQVDFDSSPWLLKSNAYTVIHARHVIEHVAYIPSFMNEIHRIAIDGAEVHIVTPHFSSIDSWTDPTHRWHLSCNWHVPFTEKRYLADQVAGFEHVATELHFAPNSLRTLIPRLIVKLKGRDWWEKHYAFVFPARNLHTILRVKKG